MTKLEKGLLITLATILMMVCTVACSLLADAGEVVVNNTVKIMLPDVESEPLERIPEPIDILVEEYKEESAEGVIEPSEGVVDDSEIDAIEKNVEPEPVETVEAKIERFVESVTEEAETAVEEKVEEDAVRYFDIPLDESLQDHIRGLCEASGVDLAIVLAMVERESKFDIYALGDNGRALGLMQIHPRWHEARMARLECWDLMDPYQNMTVAVDFIAELAASGNSIEWVLMAYNGGEAYADRKVAAGEVSEYAVEVLENAERFW